ncbi:ribbon-helix-helix protein, CopG family [Rhizobium sp. C4]|uniref:ribbon-helix-helix protein, CopG family n=1 Tax=Rhizobium sp. C4 TaxID=1349800 RepID=UPI001E29299C|nr:ribbon-helix-helix protein, CopG family [Rhizobium sp. C4]MCD2175218.1 ribbon-helix-helix protein, CopG family [Rhizobium sp. C4]
MNAITVKVSPDVEEKLKALAVLRGVDVSELIEEATSQMAADYDAYKLFREMQEEGRGLKEEALALLRK